MWVRGIAGLALCILGVVWILQGVGVLQGSYMTGQALVWGPGRRGRPARGGCVSLCGSGATSRG